MELALDQLVAILQRDMPGELDKITYERADDITLPHPTEIRPEIATVDNYPSVFVLPAMSRPQTLTSAGLIADHVVHVEAFLAHTDSRVLQRQRLRYLTAIKRTVLRLHRVELNSTQTAYSCEWIEDDYGDGLPMRDGSTGETVDSVAVRFALVADEV